MLDINKLKQTRLRLGLSQTAVAEKAGITPSHYGNIERGKRGGSIDVMEAIVQALGTTFDTLQIDDVAQPAEPPQPEKGVVFENGEGVGRIRLILPPTQETYDLVHRHVTTWERALDPEIGELVRLWRSAGAEAREKALVLLRGAADAEG